MTQTYQGNTGEINSLVVDATTGKLASNNDGCCSNFTTGAKLQVPVDGACIITVTTHGNTGQYALYDINGVEASTASNTTSVVYGGEAGYVDIVSTGNGYIATITVKEISTSWNLGTEVTQGYQGAVGEINSLIVDATAGSFASNGDNCCAMLGAGVILKVPVVGASEITVTPHSGQGQYALYKINGVQASTTDGSTTVSYVGGAGFVEIIATGTAYISTIEVVAKDVTGTDVKASLSYDGSEVAILSGTYSEATNALVFSESKLTFDEEPEASKFSIAVDPEVDKLGGTYTVEVDSTNKEIKVYNSTVSDGASCIASLPYKIAGKLVAMPVGTTESYDFYSTKLVFGEATLTEDEIFSANSYIKLNKDSSETINATTNSHGLNFTKAITFTVIVPANTMGTITINDCQYASCSADQIVGDTTIASNVSLIGENDKSSTTVFEYKNTTNENVEMQLVVTPNSRGYIHGITYAVTEIPKDATVSGTVSAELAGEYVVYTDAAGKRYPAVIAADGTYSLEVEVGTTYTVSFEQGIYKLLTGGSLDLSNASAGDTITNNITYEELSNRLVLDAAATLWDFRDASFGAYKKSTADWYSGDGLVISGTIGHNGTQHGMDASNGSVFSINVPAGQTTIVFSACTYGSGKATVVCGDESKEVVLNWNQVSADDGKETSVIFTNDSDATITITMTAQGFIHYIKAVTETVQPSATVSGTVDSAVNGEVLNFMINGATVATATIANGAYTVDLPIGSEYTVAFANAALYEIATGTSFDLTDVASGASITNNITYVKWDATKEFTLTIGDTSFTVTPGATKADDYTVVANSGSGSVELATPNTAIVWTDLEGLGGGVLASNKITNVSSNVTTSFSGNTLTVTYVDDASNPTSYTIIVKDNSAKGEAVADGTPILYDFTNGSIVSTLYNGSKYALTGGKTLTSVDGLLTLTANKKIFYNGAQHGIALGQNDSFSIKVAGDATITFVTCLYTNSQTASVLEATCGSAGTITPASQNFTSASADGEVITFEYTGEATTLVFTYTSSGSAYLHSMTVKNAVAASDVEEEQDAMPETMNHGTPESLEAIPAGQRFIFTQLGGQMNTDAAKGTINSSVSYFGFPETTGKYRLEADVVLSSCGSSNYNGIYFGAFDENYIATVAIRNSTGLRGILSKSSADMAGASTIDASIESGQKVHFVVERRDDCFAITVTPEGGTTYTIEFDYKDSGVLLFKDLGVDTPVSYGFAIAGASAIVTNMKYTDETGKVLYDQNECYAPVGTAPIVSGASAEADASREFISINWTSSVAVVGDGRYVVQVSKDGSEYITIEETTATNFDYAISEAGKYTFRVAGKLGENGEANTWVYSSELTVIAALTRPVITITSSSKDITLTWDAVDKAISYEVYRYSYDEGEANATKIATVTTPGYVDSKVEAEVPYYYYVVAISEDNYSNPSKTVWEVPTPGHTGDYVYEDEATEIFITKKSYDTVFSNKVVLEGNVYGTGKLSAVVNGTVVTTKELNSGDKFSLSLTVVEGRNDINLFFTDKDGNITRQTYNFVYLTNYDMVVDDDYKGTDGDTSLYGVPAYSTVQAAVNAVPSNNADSKVILVMAGDYEERLEVSSPYITIIGEDRENTLIHCYPADILNDADAEAGGDMSKRCAIIIKNTATGFSAENVAFANDYVYGTPDNKSNKSADAIRVEADQSSFVNVKFSGVQDTLYMHSGKQYYYKCVIEGLVDFIYSGDAARSYFNDCDIVFVFEATKTSGYVCAPRTAADATYGLTFNNCRILREEGCNGTGYLLARPWGPNAYITWINCYMGKVINKYEPYNDMSGNSYEAARFYEFGTYGPGFMINADRRQISPTQAEAMVSAKYLGWDPAAVVTALSSDHYVGSVSTDKEEIFDTAEKVNDEHAWTEGDDEGLKMFDQEGYADAYGVTGGGLLLETSKNYYKVATAEEFLQALIAIKASGKASVIELTADINLGSKEVKNFANYSDVIKAYGAQALTHPTLIESGVSVVTFNNLYNVTIFSQNGASIKHANITMKNSENIIVRNIKFDELWEWDEETDGNYDRNDWDFITIDSNCDGIWIDHCTFYKAYDGVIDIKNPGYVSNVTISWCEFLPGSEDNVFFDVMMDEITANPDKYPYYQSLLKDGLTKEQAYKYAYFQKKTHLFGQDDSYTNAKGIRVTLANNYYKNTMDRMPRLRYGIAHVYNCVMDSKDILEIRLALGNSPLTSKFVSNGASSTCGAQMLLENCYIRDIQDALNSGNGNSPSGYINAINSLYYMNGKLTKLEPKAKSHTDDRILITDAESFLASLPYSDYTLYDAKDLRGIIPFYAGAGKLELTSLQWEKTSYNAQWEDPIINKTGDLMDSTVVFMITLLGAAFVTAGFFAKKKFAIEE